MSDVVERQIILGAGASDGYPAGSKLLEDIKEIGDYIENVFSQVDRIQDPQMEDSFGEKRRVKKDLMILLMKIF